MSAIDPDAPQDAKDPKDNTDVTDPQPPPQPTQPTQPVTNDDQSTNPQPTTQPTQPTQSNLQQPQIDQQQDQKLQSSDPPQIDQKSDQQPIQNADQSSDQPANQQQVHVALQKQTVLLDPKIADKKDKDKDNVSNATTKVMKSLTTCLINEIQSSRIDYSLLRELNNKSAIEYIDMTQRSKLLLQSMNIMKQQENKLMNELTKIDDLVDEVNKLDTTVTKLDEYTKNLHAQFFKLYSSK